MPPSADLPGKLLRQIVDVVPRAIVVTDATGIIRLWSDAAQRLYGWSEGDVLGRPIFEILDPGKGLSDRPGILEALLAGEELHQQLHLVRSDGGTVHVNSVTRALLDADGQIELIVGATDELAELAALELETKELSDHLRLALDAGGFGTWRWDMATGVTQWDQEMERLFGLAPGTFDGTFDAWKALLHPDDVAPVLQVLDAAVANRSHYRLEHRVVTADGTVRWLEGSGRVTLDQDGNVTGTIGCSHDISERARAVAERERLAEVAVESLARERVQRERLELVAAVNEALEDSDDLPGLMARITTAVVPRLGDWCALHILDTDTSVAPLVEIAHTDPDMVRFARHLQARHPYDPDAPTGIAAVIRTGQPEFHPIIDDELIDSLDPTPEQRQILSDLGVHSAMTVPLTKQGRALGAMQFVMSQGHRSYTDEDLGLAQAVCARIAATLDNRRLRRLAERTARTDASLAGLGRRLAASASIDQVLGVISEDAPRVLGADAVDVALALDAESLTISGSGRRVALADAGPLSAAMGQAETILHQGAVRHPGREDTDGTAGALVASPLYDDVHDPMGVLVLSWDQAVIFDEIDLNAIETLSRLCGQAIVRSQFAGHTQQMADLAAAMAAARTTTEVARLLREHGKTNLRASVANLRLIDADTATVRTALPSDAPDRFTRLYERVALESKLPLTDAIRDEQAVWIDDLDEYRGRYPGAADDAEEAGLGALAIQPLYDSDGEPIGAMAFAWPAAMRFDHRLRSQFATMGDLAAQTLERVRLFEAEHAVIASLQRRLLAPLPDVDGVQMAAHYQPAASAIGMGGDWYEAVPLGDGSVVVILGDVVGHGVDAVVAMSQIQHLLTGLLQAGTPLGDVLARANAMIAGPEPIYATALLLHLDPLGRRVGYANAGHPPALLRDPAGSVRLLDANQHPMFGLALGPFELVYEPMEEGALVLAYTDGLVERRNETIDEGMDRLAGLLARLEGDELETALRELVDTVSAADPNRRATTDDVAAVLIRAQRRRGT